MSRYAARPEHICGAKDLTARVSRSAFIGAALLMLLSSALAAQSIQTVPVKQCVWRAGDNPVWLAPNLDDSSWQPYSTWDPLSPEPRMLVRCHVDLSSLQTSAQPALQIALYAAYEVYIDGHSIGSSGNLQSGQLSMNAVRNWPLPTDATHPIVLELRIARQIVSMAPVGAVPPAEVRAGSLAALRVERDSEVLARVRQHSIPALCFSVIGIIGFVLLGLYLNDRSRLEVLILGIQSVALPFIYLNYLAVAAYLNYSAMANFAIWAVPATVTNVTRTVFFFTLARRRVPLIFWGLIFLAVLPYAITFVVPFLAPAQAIWLDTLRSHRMVAISGSAAVLESFAPVAAFLPWKNLSHRMKPLAILCIIWGMTMAVFFTVRLSGAQIPGIPDLASRWSIPLADAEAIATLSVIVALLALLFREQQQTAHDRALLAGELHAAREIQGMLAPASIMCAPGLKIGVAFHPMRDVGGDFYACGILPENRQRIFIGDVSGKGAAAAMTAAVLIGAAQRRDHECPAALLDHLNHVLVDMNLGGFATCLCAELSADGLLTLANAGHLAPYRNGEEILIESGLPLGISTSSKYCETSFELAHGDRLTFLSDGVVEAQTDAGELFGFDRTAAISIESAEAIAAAARVFGQEDDITVLTLTFA